MYLAPVRSKNCCKKTKVHWCLFDFTALNIINKYGGFIWKLIIQFDCGPMQSCCWPRWDLGTAVWSDNVKIKSWFKNEKLKIIQPAYSYCLTSSQKHRVIPSGTIWFSSWRTVLALRKQCDFLSNQSKNAFWSRGPLIARRFVYQDPILYTRYSNIRGIP